MQVEMSLAAADTHMPLYLATERGRGHARPPSACMGLSKKPWAIEQARVVKSLFSSGATAPPLAAGCWLAGACCSAIKQLLACKAFEGDGRIEALPHLHSPWAHSFLLHAAFSAIMTWHGAQWTATAFTQKNEVR